MLLVAGTTVAQLPQVWSVAEYLGVLDLALVISSVGAVVWLLSSDTVESRLGALLIVALANSGHVLAKTLGLPGASILNGAPGSWELVIMAVQLAALGAIGAELITHRQARRPGNSNPSPASRRTDSSSIRRAWRH